MDDLRALNAEQRQAMIALMADLRYPAGPDGGVLALLDGLPFPNDDPNVVDSMRGRLAYHLMMAGWRVDLNKRRRKARKVFGAGMFDDAVVWVDISEPDDPLADLANMTIAQIDALTPEDVRLEARRRVGLPVPTPEPPPGWQANPLVDVIDAPEPDDEGTTP